MGRLFDCAQVHPGLSGFEKVDLARIDVHRRLRIGRQARLGLHSPDHVIGLPFLKSERASVPNMYCLMADGVTSAFHTAALGASITTDALAIRS